MLKENDNQKPDIAVVIPCFNEVTTIAKVIRDFQRESSTTTRLMAAGRQPMPPGWK
jgi:hypothetical protein